MSTTIYTAYRCKLVDLPRAIEYLRDRMWQRIRESARHRVKDYDSAVKYVEGFGECGFHLWLDTDGIIPRAEAQMRCGYAYFILWGLPHFTEFTRTPRWLPEYRYWTSTDKPSHISRKEWDARGANWNRVAISPAKWYERLTFFVLQNNVHGALALCRKLRIKL